LFLDIEMPGMSGFDLLEKVPFRLNVIFVTSSETEAIRAFEVNALDYLVKPVDPDRLGQSIKRLSEARGVHNERWEEVRESLSYYDWIYLPMARAQVFVMAAHILRIESCRNNTRVFMKDGRCFQIRRSLNHWEARLDSDCFCRINREMIINLKTVNQILNHDSGAVCLDIFGGTFPISRRRIKVLRERLVV
ncbi:MAG: LytTR family DNA-binding domain-containing protein, partial [Verrucomicrobiota bacterium]